MGKINPCTDGESWETGKVLKMNDYRGESAAAQAAQYSPGALAGKSNAQIQRPIGERMEQMLKQAQDISNRLGGICDAVSGRQPEGGGSVGETIEARNLSQVADELGCVLNVIVGRVDRLSSAL